MVFLQQTENRTQNKRILLQDKRSGEPLQSQSRMILQGPAASANLLGTATKLTPASRQERRRTEISSHLQSFIPLSIGKAQMDFSLSEDHSAPGKLKLGRPEGEGEKSVCTGTLLCKLSRTPLISSKCAQQYYVQTKCLPPSNR